MSKKTYNSGEPSLGLELDEETATEQKGPVTVLGLTFSNDDERREYFRAELHRKLPELRNIEGFPIGEDDDIIALSDPPYYTACPNPWLNDFIAEWEAEKKDLEAKGLRKTDFEVTEPYSADVSEGKNNPVYTAHTYHTKVPHPAIMRYILHYTQPGDIIFDGFCGTGMTGVAAQACAKSNNEWHSKIESEFVNSVGHKPKWGKRHAICGDLSPYASMISNNYNSPTDISLLKSETQRIMNELKDECGWMYTTLHDNKPIGCINYMVWSDVAICQNCGKEFIYWDSTMSKEKEGLLDNFECPYCKCSHTKATAKRSFQTVYDDVIDDVVNVIKHVPVVMVYTVKGKHIEREPLAYDIDLLKKIDQHPIDTKYIPIQLLPEGYNTEQPKKTQGYFYVHQFYTRRNLIALSILFKKIYESKYPSKLMFLFTAMIGRSTKMQRVHINNYFHGGGGWNAGNLKGTLYIPPFPVETSVLEQIGDKLRLLLKAEPYLPHSFDNVIQVASALKQNMYTNSVDYIFTDPPFGANINYSELNSLPEAWLRVTTNNETEVIENSAQGKSPAFYHNEMQKCFSEYYRILKPGRWMTVEFSNTKASVLNFIQSAITSVGFIIANVASLDKKQGSYKSVTTTTAVKQDLIISCFKPSEKLLAHFENMRQSDDNQNIFVSTQSFIEELLTRLPVIIVNEKKTTAVVERSPKILYDRLIAFFVQNGRQIPMDASEFQRFLRDTFVERDGMFFTAEQAIKYDDLRRQNPEMVSLALFVGSEADGVQWLKRELVDKPQTYQDLQPKWMQDLVAPKKGDAIPELMQILEENFLKNEDSQWYIPDAENEADLEKVRTRRLLREFKTYVEAAEKPKGRIKEARLEALRTGFKNCYQEKDFATIVRVGDRIPQSLLTEDDVLLQYYDIATNRI